MPSTKISPPTIKPGDLEGSFRIAEEVSRGAYCLEQLDGKKIPWTWNTMNLRLYKDKRPEESAHRVPPRHEDKDLRSQPTGSLPGTKTKDLRS
ncbi:hypothetical protein CR513_36391, partial [Mucuna pruriens]